MYGAHQVKNALAAVLLAHEASLSNDEFGWHLKASLTDMRMQPVLSDNGALFINDAYNAAPTSMRAALTFIEETDVRSKKWVVLGDMLELGEDEQDYHEASCRSNCDNAFRRHSALRPAHEMAV